MNAQQTKKRVLSHKFAILFACLLGISGNTLANAESISTKTNVEYNNKQFTISASNSKIGPILKEISEKTGAKITVLDKVLLTKPVTVDIKSQEIHYTIKKLLKDFSYSFSLLSDTPRLFIYNYKADVMVAKGKKSYRATSPRAVQEPELAAASESMAAAQPYLNEESLPAGELAPQDFTPTSSDPRLNAYMEEASSRSDAESIEQSEIEQAEAERLREVDDIAKATDIIQNNSGALPIQAIDYLVGKKSVDATAALVQVANNRSYKNPDERVVAVEALISHAADLEFRDTQSINAIRALASDKNPEISQMAQDALQGMEAYLKVN